MDAFYRNLKDILFEVHDHVRVILFVLPVSIVDHFSCVDSDTHRIPTSQGWPSRQLVTKCLAKSSYDFVSLDRDRCEKARPSSHQPWIWWHFSRFLHRSKSTVRYCYWLVMVSPVVDTNNYFLSFRLLDMCAIHAIGIAHNQLESILVAYDPCPLNIDSTWDTKCTKTNKENLSVFFSHWIFLCLLSSVCVRAPFFSFLIKQIVTFGLEILTLNA